jgi:hypothetical protein
MMQFSTRRTGDHAEAQRIMGRQIHVDLERTIPAPPARVHAARLRLSTVWEGHGGLGGFFERTFAPRGLRRIHGELLDNLTRRLGAEPA